MIDAISDNRCHRIRTGRYCKTKPIQLQTVSRAEFVDKWPIYKTNPNESERYRDFVQYAVAGRKAQILKWAVRDLGDDFPGIDSRPDVCGGKPCLVRTRIPVWLPEQTRRLGASEYDLLVAYPSLRAADEAA